MTTERDIRNQIAFAEKKGIKRGERNRSLAIAKNLKRMNMPIESIAEATGLSVEDIASM